VTDDPRDFWLAPGDPPDTDAPQLLTRRARYLLDEVTRRQRLDEADDPVLADPGDIWRPIR